MLPRSGPPREQVRREAMTTSSPIVIQTQDLGKTYGDIQALQSLNLAVPQHSIFGFLGPNGAGKTTTIKLLLGLIWPTQGGATIFGLDTVTESVHIRTRVGYLAQNPRFYEHLTARETLDFTARFFFKGPDAAIEERVAEMLELVGLEEKADRPIKSFSGGERQRLGIAQAQVNYPDLLILDEPAASLDPLGRHNVLEIMERLRKHTTVFFSTHILDDVQQVSDTVAILNQGQLVAHGSIDELLASRGGVVFSVTMRGDVEAAHERVAGQDWVTDVSTRKKNGSTTWTVSVSDAAAAEARLLRLLLSDESLVVTDYGRKEYELEEVFIDIVEKAALDGDTPATGGSHDRE
jgi:ABC-2 type transport system ATP-binding protein